MGSKKGGIPAGELMRQLEADPIWVARRDAQARARLQRELTSQREQTDLLQDLKASGVSVNNVWSLVNTAGPYPGALRVLLDHLSRPYSDRVREGIARALAVKEARPVAWDEFVRLARTEASQSWVSDGVMVAIAAMARPSDLDEIISLITDRLVGPGRVFLVRNLTRSKKQKARQVLMDLRDDPDLQREIAARLKVSIRS